MHDDSNPLYKLELPRRWELLEARADEAEIDPAGMVERVDEAAEHVDRLLRRVRTGGGGLIEVVFGLSGSGKTTFLKTIPKFFDGIRLSSFPRDKALSTLPAFIRDGYVSTDKTQRVVLIERRDNPNRADLDEVEDTFSELLDLFREPEGAAVILCPSLGLKAPIFSLKLLGKSGVIQWSTCDQRASTILKGFRERSFLI